MLSWFYLWANVIDKLSLFEPFRYTFINIQVIFLTVLAIGSDIPGIFLTVLTANSNNLVIYVFGSARCWQ